jgi:hypothetical membrane protein
MNEVTRESDPVTKVLLTCGVILAPLFYIVVLIQMATRPGFDITRHAISGLSNGDFGWVQTTNFIVTGTLALLVAVGVSRALRGGKAGTWAPILIGAYGAGIVLAGLFPPDPAMGFPVGAPEGMSATMSTSAMLHSVGFFTAFTSLVAACFVFGRRFIAFGQRGWGIYSIATGVAAPILITLGTTVMISSAGVFFFIAGVVSFGWLSAVAAHLLAERRTQTFTHAPIGDDSVVQH